MAKFSEQTIQQIAAANDVVEIIGSYFPLKRAGAVFKALCPFHQEKTPSFTVNPQRQIFKCFGCGAGGGVFKFVEMYENLSFPEAVRKLANRAGIPLVEEQSSAGDDRRHQLRRRLLSLHLDAAEWFHRNLLKSPAAQVARDYLKARGIDVEIAKGWKIGYAPESWDSFANWAGTAGYSRDEILQSGMVKLRDEQRPQGESYDRFRNRVMFPICNDLGEVIAFSGRVLKAETQEAKYVNSPETMLFTKGNVLFGLHKSKRALIAKQSAIVCEGQLDLITAYEAGVQNVIAPQGTAFTGQQARILKRYVEEVVLCFDADAAGQKAAERSLASLLDSSLFVRVAEMPPGHDPDSLIREQGAEAFARQIAQAKDFFEYQIHRQTSAPDFATPRVRMQFARKMAGWASLITDRVVRESVVANVAQRIGLSIEDFRRLIERQKPRREFAGEMEAAPGAPPRKLSELMSWLCLLALRHGPSRQWIQERPWRKLLAGVEDGDLLIRILESDVRPDQSESTVAFLTTLEPGDAALVSALLFQKVPDDLNVAHYWNGLESAEFKRRLHEIASRLGSPEANLSAADMAALHREMLLIKLEHAQSRLTVPDLPPSVVEGLHREIACIRAQALEAGFELPLD